MCIAIMKKRRFLNVCRLIHLQDTKIEKKNRKPDLAYGSFFFENTLLILYKIDKKMKKTVDNRVSGWYNNQRRQGRHTSFGGLAQLGARCTQKHTPTAMVDDD